jgi:hypothetical protein
MPARVGTGRGVLRSDDEARVFLKDAVPDDGRALAQYRAWLSRAFNGANLARFYAGLFGRRQRRVDAGGRIIDREVMDECGGGEARRRDAPTRELQACS